MNTNIIVRNSVSLLLLGSLLVALIPGVASAQERGTGATFCANIGDAREKALDRLGDKRGTMDRSGEHETKKAKRLTDLETKRGENDHRREDRYEKLRDRATTDEQIAAVEEFVSTVEDLVETRRAVIDDAIADFEAAVKALTEERATAIEEAAADIEAGIEDIFDTAEEACDDGDSPKDVREDFMADMKELRAEKKAERSSYNLREELAAARADRQAAIRVAREAFQADLEEAKEKLRAAFGG